MLSIWNSPNFGKGVNMEFVPERTKLTPYHTIPTFNDPGKESF